MCTEHITKHRLFPKEKTEFYKILVKGCDNEWYSPYRQERYPIGKKIEAFIDGQLACKQTDLYRLNQKKTKCSVAIHLFEHFEDAKEYQIVRMQFHTDKLGIGVFHCDPEDFYCCGLTEDYPRYRFGAILARRWLPTACYNAATLVRVEELDAL